MFARRRAAILFAALLAPFLAGCVCPIASEWRAAARKDLTFSTVLRNPAEHKGAVVIWGGYILDVTNLADSTRLTILQAPLCPGERPGNAECTQGRFIAVNPAFLDPAVYSKGRMVTFAGEVTGKESQKLGEMEYAYPVVAVKQIYLWKPLPPAYFCPYPGPCGEAGGPSVLLFDRAERERGHGETHGRH